jgi:release factor glutamine methyltransferase
MQTLIRYIVANTYKPLLVKYLSRNRQYTSNGITVQVPPEVFHPGFFFSTKLLLRAILKIPIRNRSFLELGAGSGFIAMQADKQGAIATASDINPVAIEYLQKNKLHNKSSIRIIQSDLFKAIPLEAFDIIAINPPYYKKDPRSPAGYAWYCGKKCEFFERLFDDIGNYMHAETKVLMILCDGCDIDMIRSMSASKGFSMTCIEQSRNLVERNYIFSIKKA